MTLLCPNLCARLGRVANLPPGNSTSTHWKRWGRPQSLSRLAVQHAVLHECGNEGTEYSWEEIISCSAAEKLLHAAVHHVQCANFKTNSASTNFYVLLTEHHGTILVNKQLFLIICVH
jgi:hypothetical protein